MSPSLPEDILAFLQAHITSLEHLEMLRLLRDRGAMAAADLTRALASSDASIVKRGDDLVASELARREGEGATLAFAFAAQGPRVELVDAILAMYRERRLAVIEAIYRRSDPGLRQFSDAFKLRKDPP